MRVLGLLIGLTLLATGAQAREVYKLGRDGAFRANAPIERIISQHRNGLDAGKHCWRTTYDQANYCLGIFRIDEVNARDGKRTYVMLGSDTPDGGHPTPGIHEAYVIDARGKVIARSDIVGMNGMGSAASDWQLIALGPNDYWGWIGTSGYTAQGFTETSYVILAPRGNKVATVGEIPGGVAPDSDVQIRFNKAGQPRVYPIVATMKSKKGQARVFEVPFDLKAWKYVVPKGLANGG